MRRWLAPSLALVLLATAARAGGNTNFVLGPRALDAGFWDPVDGQQAVGVTVDFHQRGWPVGLEAGFQVSGDDTEVGTVDVKGGVAELSFGINKTWDHVGRASPFIGGGIASVVAAYELDGSTVGDDDDGSLGFYVHGGAFWRLGRRFNIGVDARLLGGTDVTLLGTSGDANYSQVGLVLGWGWPARK